MFPSHDRWKIKVWYKDLGKDPFYKGNVANIIHSIDATLMREVVARCNYDRDAILKSMSKLHRVLNITVDEVSLLAKTVGTTMNQELKSPQRHFMSQIALMDRLKIKVI